MTPYVKTNENYVHILFCVYCEKFKFFEKFIRSKKILPLTNEINWSSSVSIFLNF